MSPCHPYKTRYNCVAGRDGIPYTGGSYKHLQVRQPPKGDQKWLYCFGFGKVKKVLPITGHEGAPRPGRFTPRKDPVPIVQEAGWAPGPVWTGAENLAPTGIRSPDRPARSESLYRLRYPGP
jgi:hypothetical protein